MALIGSIIGDIIGSQYEFPSMRPKNLDWMHCELFTNKCEYTDDTVMSIATKYALDHYKGNFAKAYHEFGRKYPHCGYGDKFFHWIRTHNAAPYGSWGNGSAMRVSYIGDVVQDLDNVVNLSKHSALCTHNSEAGIRGAIVTAGMVAMGNRHYTKADMYGIANKFYKDNLYDCSQSLDEIRKEYVWNEICDDTVPVAIRCFLESDDYESCIRNCLSLPCDMDTMCCIAGGIAEAYYGTTGLDNEKILKQYLDTYLYDCIKDVIK